MSRRPLEKKRAASLRRSLALSPKERIDLVEWLKLHRYADTTGQAKKIIEAGRVKSESHPLKDRFVNAELRGTLHVTR